MAQARAKTVQQKRENKCTQPSSMQPAFTASPWRGCWPTTDHVVNKGDLLMGFGEEVAGFRNHVTTHGSLLGGEWCSSITVRRWGRCTGCTGR